MSPKVVAASSTSPAAAFEFPADAPSQTKAPEPFAFTAQVQPLKKCSPSDPVSFSNSFDKSKPQGDKTKATLKACHVRFDSKMVLARLDSLFGLSSGAISLYGRASDSPSDSCLRSFDCSCDSYAGFMLVLPLFNKKTISQLKQRLIHLLSIK
jgi:hypothetical protein